MSKSRRKQSALRDQSARSAATRRIVMASARLHDKARQDAEHVVPNLDAVFVEGDEEQIILKELILRVEHESNDASDVVDTKRCDAFVTRLGALLPPEVRADRIDEWRDELCTARERGCSLKRRTLSICLRALPAEVIRARFLRRKSRQEA